MKLIFAYSRARITSTARDESEALQRLETISRKADQHDRRRRKSFEHRRVDMERRGVCHALNLVVGLCSALLARSEVMHRPVGTRSLREENPQPGPRGLPAVGAP